MLPVDGAPPPYSKTVSELLFLKLMALSVPLLLRLPVLPGGKCVCISRVCVCALQDLNFSCFEEADF